MLEQILTIIPLLRVSLIVLCTYLGTMSVSDRSTHQRKTRRLNVTRPDVKN